MNPKVGENDKVTKQPRQVRLPGFIVEKNIGLGDAIKNVTTYLGLPPCAGCEKRVAALNGRVVLKGRAS